MGQRIARCLVFLGVAFAWCGCSFGPAKTFLSAPPGPVSQWSESIVAVRVDHEVLPHLERFAVFPGDALSKDLRDRRSRALPLLYVARNVLEAQGYEWSNNEYSQVIVTLDWRITEGHQAVLPSQFWTGRVTAAQGDLAALRLNAHWGQWEAAPDPSMPEATPEGWRAVALRVVAFDSRSGEVIWDATGYLGTDETRAGVILPHLLEDILTRFPRAVRPVARLRPGDGRLGITLQMRTTDGLHFLPEVLGVSDDAPARKELRPGDRIAQVEEQSVYDLGLGELFNRLRGPPGAVVRITLEGHDEPIFVERFRGN